MKQLEKNRSATTDDYVETELDRKFDEGKEDILHHFDLSTASRPNLELKRLNLDLPQWVVNSLDRESKRIGVTRQSLIKMWLADRLESKAAT